jgi:hypothetical protein|tara:strand:+ start:205 stop:594 length:390 start_codon:yes stop_codon:yes gene_type:complete
MIPFIGPLISAVSSIGGSWMENKLQETKANSQVKIAKAEAEAEVHKKVATGEIEWEKTMAKASGDSWKDEYLVVVLTVPAILVFVPGMEDLIQRGFIVLDTLPDWYQNALMIAISASFGIKGFSKFLGK